MFWACGKNGRVPYRQKGADGEVNGGSKWNVGTRKTEVRLDEWCGRDLGNRIMTVEAARNI